MGKIYTKTGDEGLTSLSGGLRVEKDDVRIEANGQIDELNCLLGIVITMMVDEDEHKTDLMTLQNELMNAMSIIATPEGREPHRHLSSDLVEYLESQIDILSTSRQFRFVLPGVNALEAHLQMARSKCRTAERRLWTAHRQYPIDPTILKFFNRLSDYLFALALHYSDNHRYHSR